MPQRFVADFVGEPPTKFFDARFVEEGGEALLHADDLTLRSTPETAARLRSRRDERYVIGIRPQNLLCTPRAGTIGFDATIDIHEYLGERSILTLRRGRHGFQALAPAEGAWAQGEPIALHYRPEDIMVLDAESEAAEERVRIVRKPGIDSQKARYADFVEGARSPGYRI